jgi:hypothetical protein
MIAQPHSSGEGMRDRIPIRGRNIPDREMETWSAADQNQAVKNA